MNRFCLIAILGIFVATSAFAQTTAPSTRPMARTDAHGNPLRVAAKTGHVSNYDEEKVGNYTLPDPLVLSNGQPVRDADTWMNQRRPEIIALYENEIYGRVPDNAPKVTWEVASTDTGALNGTATTKHVVGHIGDKPDGPQIKVTLDIPSTASGPVPVIFCINFGFGAGGPGARRGAATAPLQATRRAPPRGGAGGFPGGDPITDILARGWAYATVTYTDIQPDRIDSFTSGVIGLTLAPGQTAPAANEWGTISAWAWGMSRVVDYFETDKSIDAKQVAIMGHSRLGKTVLWEMAHDPRIALCFSSCGGELGSALARRDFGETVDDMAQNYPWQFSGNLQKYAGHWNEMPVDTNMLISLCAPRPLFVGGGTTDQWSDPRGEFLGELAAGPVYRLLGKKDLGVTDLTPRSADANGSDFQTELDAGPVLKYLAMKETGLSEMLVDSPYITGDLGWNYHAGGHMASPTDWKTFLNFAAKYFKVRA